MRRFRPSSVAIVGTSVVVPAVAVLVDRSGPTLPNLLFGAVVVATFLTVLRLAVRAGRRGVQENRRARHVTATREEAVRRALIEERALLAADVVAVVRRAATTMGVRAQAAHREWYRRPEPALRAVQDEGRRAGVELRRLLGLLRDTPPPQLLDESAGPRWSIMRDGAPAVLATTDVVVEHLLYSPSPGPASLLLTVLAAATVVFRRIAPGPGAACCGLVLAFSIATVPISSGFWVLVTVGGLMWAATARRTPGGAAVLSAGAVVAYAVHNPENLGITVAILVVAGAGGSAVGWSAAATARADRYAAEQTALVERARHAERTAVARDLHDVVSHAIGVMAMQAGAALVLRATDPDRARGALDVVRGTAADTVEEFDRLVAVVGDGVHREVPALHALVDRMRAAGLAVSLRVDGHLGEYAAVSYRIVQESLTNVLPHAPGAAVRVEVAARDDGVRIEVVDDGPGPGPAVHAGYGLVGLAERVHGLGGELITGPGPDGRGFRVQARLLVVAHP